jgi:hypothetical protein
MSKDADQVGGISAPVTFGQLSMLRGLDHLGPQGVLEVHLVRIYEIPAETGLESAARAWRELVRRHESLRTVYSQTGAEPLQVIRPFEKRSLPAVELHGPTVADAVAVAMTEEWVGAPFDIESDEPHRAFVGTYNGVPKFLGLVVHHIAADYTSCAVLGREYTALLLGEKLPPVEQPRSLAAVQRLRVAARRRTADYWASEWSGFVEGDCTGIDTSERTQASLYSELGLRAADAIARRLRISVPSVILGVTCLGLMNARGTDRTTIGLMASNRVDKTSKSIVSSLNQLAPLTVELDPGVAPGDWLRSVFKKSLEVYRHASFHIDELARHLRGCGYNNPDPSRFDLFFNYLGDTGVSLPDDLEKVHLKRIHARRQTGPTFNLFAEIGAGIFLRMRTSRNYLGPEESDLLLAGIEAALIDIDSGAPATLAAVSFEPVREVVRVK